MIEGLQGKMLRLEKRLKARTKANGEPKGGYEQNVAHIRAEMELISGRIEFVKAQMEEIEFVKAQMEENNGE